MDDVKQERVKNLEAIIENMHAVIDKLQLELDFLKQEEQSVEFNSDNNDIDFDNKVNVEVSNEQSKLQKLNQLKDKNVVLGSRQRITIIKKQDALNKRNTLFSKQESKVDDNLAEENKIVDRFYDIKGKFYEKKVQHQNDVLSAMKNDNVGFVGANVILIKNAVCNVMRSSIKNAYIKQQLNQMFQQNNENDMVNAKAISM